MDKEAGQAPKSQLDKFKDAARDLDCDDDDLRFKKRLGQMLRAPKNVGGDIKKS